MAEKKKKTAKLAHNKVDNGYTTALLCPKCEQENLITTMVWPRTMWLVCPGCDFRRRLHG